MKCENSPNADARPEGSVIDMLVIHYTGMAAAAEALDRMMDPDAEVSAHYMIDEDGSIAYLVNEERRAWHAGVAYWRGETAVNARSIGIELVNPGHDLDYRAFPPAQMTALTALAGGLVDKYPIPARNVVGHADVAPTRKRDPGERFDWRGLAAAGIGVWPALGAAPGGSGESRDGVELLGDYGYDISAPEAAVRAFQRHFRAAAVDGVMDAASTAIGARLLELA